MMAERQLFARWQDFAAQKAALKANALIPGELTKGRILDIGCGFFPHLKTQTDFSEKYGLSKGIDKRLRADLKRRHDVALVDIDLEYSARLPFKSSFFEVVTMLAVLEHVEPRRVLRIIQEIERILKPGGVLIMTTPAKWTKGLLEFLVRINVVSRMEIQEHRATRSKKQILTILEQGGFPRFSITSGYFEFFMNIWARAKKEPNLFKLEELEPLEG